MLSCFNIQVWYIILACPLDRADFCCACQDREDYSVITLRGMRLFSKVLKNNSLFSIFWPFRIPVLYSVQYLHAFHDSAEICSLEILLAFQTVVDVFLFQLPELKKYSEKLGICLMRGSSACLCPYHTRSQTSYGKSDYLLSFCRVKSSQRVFFPGDCKAEIHQKDSPCKQCDQKRLNLE